MCQLASDMEIEGRRRQAEQGITLIELLVTIVILGIGVAGLVAALGGSLSATGRARQGGEVAQVVTRVAEAIQNAAWECNTASPTSTYSGLLAGLLPNSSWSITVADVAHWGPSRAFEAGCPSATDGDVFRTISMSVTVTGPASLAQRTIAVVKRP
jgi:prepilin-type N-terminal cleavage/methylation domain-containing protein